MTRSSALLVVDVQNGFINDKSKHVVPVIRDLAAKWTELQGDIIFTRYHNYPGSPYERLIGWHGLMDSPQTDIASELTPFLDLPNTRTIDKRVYTAFTDAGREALSKYSDLYICGIATDGCVLKTALDAFEGGYTPWVIEDACASNATRHPASEVHRSALTLMSRLVGANQIIQSTNAVSALSSACRTS